MTRAWTNFAKTGDPGVMGEVKWEEAFEEKASDKVTRHMSLNVNAFQMVSGIYRNTCDHFWKDKIEATQAQTLDTLNKVKHEL